MISELAVLITLVLLLMFVENKIGPDKFWTLIKIFGLIGLFVSPVYGMKGGI